MKRPIWHHLAYPSKNSWHRFSSESALLRAVLEKLASSFDLDEVHLCGSRARRDHRPDSDFDLVMVWPYPEDWDKDPYAEPLRALRELCPPVEIVPCPSPLVIPGDSHREWFIEQMIVPGRKIYDREDGILVPDRLDDWLSDPELVKSFRDLVSAHNGVELTWLEDIDGWKSGIGSVFPTAKTFGDVATEIDRMSEQDATSLADVLRPEMENLRQRIWQAAHLEFVSRYSAERLAELCFEIETSPHW